MTDPNFYIVFWLDKLNFFKTSEFFKESWLVIGDDVTVAVQSFFLKGFLPKGLNSTILALIPKKEEAKEMKDYRPISCCNVIYKVISKLIANRLKIITAEMYFSKPICIYQRKIAYGERATCHRAGKRLS